MRPLLLAALVSASLLVGAGTSLARFTSTQSSVGNTLATGNWVYYLHNNPTPPTGDTTAQFNLTATTAASTQATLYDYDTNCDNRTGRQLARVSPTPGQATTCNYANWRMPALGADLTLKGTVTADVWSAIDAGSPGSTGSLIAYLRDYDPATGTYVEIASGTYTGIYAASRTFYERPISVAIGGQYVLAAGHRLELKLEAPSATAQRDMMVAYDATAYPSALRLR